MNIKLIAMGNKQPGWVSDAYNEYAKRLPTDYALELIEIPLAKRTKNTTLEQIYQKEGEAMMARIAPRDVIVTLDVKATPKNTEQLANQLQNWHSLNQTISMLIGGPDGLAPLCQQKAHMGWSLSPLTLPHALVRIIVAEQLYRAWSIIHQHPYHRS